MSEHPAAEVIVYTTSSTSLPKTKKDVQSLRFLLDSKRVLYEEYDVSLDSMRRNEMWAKSNERTLPQVFINGKYVGGFDEMEVLNEEGVLDVLLSRAPSSKNF